jgi:hypothetical protein
MSNAVAVLNTTAEPPSPNKRNMALIFNLGLVHVHVREISPQEVLNMLTSEQTSKSKISLIVPCNYFYFRRQSFGTILSFRHIIKAGLICIWANWGSDF